MGESSQQGPAEERRSAEFDALFDAHFAGIVRYIGRRIPEKGMAQDLAAETFLAAWEHIRKDSTVDLPWLYTVARRRIVDHYRARERAEAIEVALVRAREERPAGLELDEVIALHDVVRQLSSREREAVMLHYWEGHSAAEIGEIIGTSEAAVWSILSRARKALRALLEGSASTDAGGGGDD